MSRRPRRRRRPPLVVGLGNPMAGDDGVGRHLARRLRGHALLPPGTEVLEGDDLLRLQEELHDRPIVYILDALLEEDGAPGTLERIDEIDALDAGGATAHLLAPTPALRLLRRAFPELREVPVVLLGIHITGAEVGERLSPALSARMEALVDQLLGLLRRRPDEPSEDGPGRSSD